eukprot:CAMPEP_0204114126 /NCGR_PEP_ID=MMETSP0361-20130328/4063_1 /ASSEMBLY_ACC=CAM_ASM_000343 /TAXON_ID=268821 /ORGANISM="Scrippsiella Hangoei, Strain SHTV-5" /LENGTH=603 /DNA_ID=CAMNT_0051064605 /DNA_START=1 /DNA_END=1812 /DNA_ORIENTATION=+
MAPDKVDNGEQAHAPLVLQCFRCIPIVFMPILSAMLHASLCGDIGSDPVDQIVDLVIIVGVATVTLMRLVGAIALNEEVIGYVALMMVCLALRSCIMLSPFSSAGSIAETMTGVPILYLAIHLLVACFSVELRVDWTGSRWVNVFYLGWVVACASRFSWDIGSRQVMQGSFKLVILMPILGQMIVYAKDQVLLARMIAQKAKVQVETISKGMSRMLTALCDVKLRLDSDFCIEEPSGQLGQLLMPRCSNAVSQLAGRSFLNFMATTDEGDRARKTLERGSSCAASQGAAGAFRVQLKDVHGAICSTEVFYVPLGGDDQPMSYLLGLRLLREDADMLAESEVAQSAPREVPGSAHPQQVRRHQGSSSSVCSLTFTDSLACTESAGRFDSSAMSDFFAYTNRGHSVATQTIPDSSGYHVAHVAGVPNITADRMGPSCQSAGTQTATQRPPTVPQMSDRKGLNPLQQQRIAVATASVHLNSSKRAVKCFAPMSHSGLRLGIGEALAHMNFTGRGCCLLHIGAMTLHRATKDMLCDPCNRAWMPKSDWQCRICRSLHEEDGDADDDSDEPSVGSPGERAPQKRKQWCHICGSLDWPLVTHSTSSAGS